MELCDWYQQTEGLILTPNPDRNTDLHTDRLAGNKQRSVAKGYRDAYCPNDALPGFAFHQTDRDPTPLQKRVCSDGRCSNHSRVRDFDLLGHRYSLLSSVGTGGLNSVVNMLPARDEQEYALFPADDVAFISRWMKWADEHVALLKLTRPVPSLATPGPGVVDGTIMLRGDNTGAMFLFNPTSRAINVSLPLSGDSAASLGFSCDNTTALVFVRHLTSSERTSTPSNLGLLDCADNLQLMLPATSAWVLQFDQWEDTAAPVLLGGAYSNATLHGGTLTVSGVKGESGTPASLTVVLPGKTWVARVVVNGKQVSFSNTRHHGMSAVTVGGVWAGARFTRAQEILPRPAPSHPTANAGTGLGTWTGTFNVPQSVLDQLHERNASYPVQYNTDPQDSNDANVPWLAPGRLLVFIKYKQPTNDMLNITGDVDGHPLLVRKAYNTIVPNPGRFIGHWADVTPFVSPATQQVLSLRLSGKSPNLPQGVFFENVETILTGELIE